MVREIDIDKVVSMAISRPYQLHALPCDPKLQSVREHNRRRMNIGI
jgi:hypothetical protein